MGDPAVRHTWPADCIHQPMSQAQTRPFARTLVCGLLLAASAAGCLSSGKAGGAPASSSLFLLQMDWGRQVSIVDITGAVQATEVLIQPDLASDGVDYELSTNPVTQQETLKILDTAGTANFDSLLSAAQSGLPVLEDRAPTKPPPFDRVPRNAVVRLTFSAPLDANTVDQSTVQILVGDPPVLAFTARYLVQNDEAAGKGYLLIDPTVSSIQAAQSSIPQNAVGFPASVDGVSTNLVIRIPTVPDPLLGLPRVLTSTTGLRPAVQDRNTEPFEEAFDGDVTLVRALRTGSETDAYGGFLRDDRRPSLLGVFNATISSVISSGSGSTEYIFSNDVTVCRPITPKVGDVMEVGNAILVTTSVVSAGDPANYRVVAQIESGSIEAGASGLAGRYTTRYAVADATHQVCFLSIQPPPTALPAGRIDPNSTVTIRFDEPMDKRTINSMGTFVITQYENVGTPTTKEQKEAAWFRQVVTNETVATYIDRQRGYDMRFTAAGTDAVNSEFGGRVMFGPIEVSNGSTQFTLAPVAGFSEVNNDTFLQFAVALRDGPEGIHDLAGNPLELVNFVAGTPGQTHTITVRGANGTSAGGANAILRNKYFGFFGGLLDENDDGLAEYAGQVTVQPGRMAGRPSSRFSRSADVNSQSVGARNQGTPQPDPLNPAGAVTMHAYRPQDFGFGYPDPTEHNMDIEGLSWSPNAGVVFDETYNAFGLSLAHATTLPDEIFDPLSLLPIFPASGLVANSYDENILGLPVHDEVSVFNATYSPRSINLYPTNGVNYLPFPAFEQSFTWRDTGISQSFVGGSGGAGSPNGQYQVDFGLTGPFWAPDFVPSVGLSLLMRFRCYPQADRLGLNLFTTTKMQPSSALPAFRLFSAGGQDGSGEWFRVQPDNPDQGGTAPSGGFLPGGGRTPTQFDTLVYWMNADFVVRVSRSYTHWFDMGNVLNAGGFQGGILEPENPDQPAGTSMVVEYRGSLQVDHGGNPLTLPTPLTTADNPFDGYGDATLGIGSVSTPSEWTQNFADLEGQQYKFFQVRLTFIANADLAVAPTLDGFGIALDLN